MDIGSIGNGRTFPIPDNRNPLELDLKTTRSQSPRHSLNGQVVITAHHSGNKRTVAIHSPRQVSPGYTGVLDGALNRCLRLSKSGFLQYLNIDRTADFSDPLIHVIFPPGYSIRNSA